MNNSIQHLKRKILRERKGVPQNEWEQYYEYLVVEKSTVLPTGPYWEARALLSMIELAFDGSGKQTPVLVSPYLVSHLTSTAIHALNLSGDKEGFREYLFLIDRIYNGFAHTVIYAIKNELTHKLEGEECIGALGIPNWFVIWAKEKARI